MTEPIITSGVIITFLGVLGLWAKVLLNYMSKKRNHGKDNPINLGMFYQEFKDFKEAQEKWNDKREKELEKLDSRMDDLEKMKRPGK